MKSTLTEPLAPRAMMQSGSAGPVLGSDPGWREQVARATGASSGKPVGATHKVAPPRNDRPCCAKWFKQNMSLVVGLACLAAAETVVLMWWLLWPVPVCTEIVVDDCFPDWRSYAIVALLLAALAGMGLGTPPDLTMLAATMLLILSNVISRGEAYQGFSDPGPITVGAMFVVAKALNTVGAVSVLAAALLGHTNRVWLAVTCMCLTVCVLSAFVNNTPVVAALVPLVQAWAVSLDASPSKFLMPLSFSSMLGGMCTLLGTSTNLIISSRYAEDYPDDSPVGLFAPAKYGIPACIIGTIYMVACGSLDSVLPPRATGTEDDDPGSPGRKQARRFGAPATSKVKVTKARRMSAAVREDYPSRDMPRMALALMCLAAVVILAVRISKAYYHSVFVQQAGDMY